MWQAEMKAGYKYIADLHALNAEQYLAIRQIDIFLLEFSHTHRYVTLTENVSHCYL